LTTKPKPIHEHIKMQKCGYLNSKYALSWLYNENN
jgi:hypothetical protein